MPPTTARRGGGRSGRAIKRAFDFVLSQAGISVSRPRADATASSGKTIGSIFSRRSSSFSAMWIRALWLGCLDHGALNLDTRTLLRGMQVFNEAVRDLAREQGHLLIELEPAVPKDLEHSYDDCHYTTRGNEVVARQIVAALLAEGSPLARRAR